MNLTDQSLARRLACQGTFDRAVPISFAGLGQELYAFPSMHRVPGTDAWVLQLEMKGWERSFFSYTFFAPGPNDAAVARLRTFRGRDAIDLPEVLETLRGKVHETTLRSRFLDEKRKVTVYTPPGAKHHGLPVLFMADGQSTETFARTVEPLITSGAVAPFAIVGVHADLSPNAVGEIIDASRDRRSQEYLAGIAPDTHERHMRFFIEEVVPWASQKFRFSSAREDRAVFGFSNGAAFAAAAAVRNPGIFAHSLPFSVGIPELPARPEGALPRFHFRRTGTPICRQHGGNARKARQVGSRHHFGLLHERS